MIVDTCRVKTQITIQKTLRITHFLAREKIHSVLQSQLYSFSFSLLLTINVNMQLVSPQNCNFSFFSFLLLLENFLFSISPFYFKKSWLQISEKITLDKKKLVKKSVNILSAFRSDIGVESIFSSTGGFWNFSSREPLKASVEVIDSEPSAISSESTKPALLSSSLSPALIDDSPVTFQAKGMRSLMVLKHHIQRTAQWELQHISV